MKAGIAISYPGDHRKGDGQVLEGWQHADMLEQLVNYLREEIGPSWPIIICAEAFPGILPYKRVIDPRETNALWRVFTHTFWVTIPENPGHMDGTLFNIGQGIYAAHHLKCDYLIHLEEDAIPQKGVIKMMVDRLANEQLDYIGERWRPGKMPLELASLFFGCNVPYFAFHYDPYGNGLPPEPYLADLMKGRPYAMIPPSYLHTHTYDVFVENMKKVRGTSNG